MTSVLTYADYRLFLRHVLNEKSKQNPLFSLRAMARMLDMSPSHLSRTLNGSKRLSSVLARQVSVMLNHTPEEADHFSTLVELEIAKDQDRRTRLLKRIHRAQSRKPKAIAPQIFRTLADWYHFAILTLIKTRGFRDEPLWMSRRLGIEQNDARMALDRLLNIGLVEKVGRTYHAVNDADIITGGQDVLSPAIQENHRQHLDLAKTALQNLAPEMREFNNLTLAMNPSEIPKAKEMLRNFIDKFNDEMESEGASEVFQLNIQFYMLSRTEGAHQ